ncbi:MAG: hypothetical protein IRZ28_18320 [Steroidobacteraceae bacterium]|nr:hypothetical protein [Steroidobacteraceae bacterium]
MDQKLADRGDPICRVPGVALDARLKQRVTSVRAVAFVSLVVVFFSLVVKPA